jgi:glucosylceramidase
VFWRDADGRIQETWYDGEWHGPVALGLRADSGPAAGATEHAGQLLFWTQRNGHIYEARSHGHWRSPRDLTAAHHWGKASAAPGVAVNPANGHQSVLWRGARGQLYEARYSGGAWHGPFATGWRSASAPAVSLTRGGEDVFWTGNNGHLFEGRYDGRWRTPRDLTASQHWGRAGRSQSTPSATEDPSTGAEWLFWRGRDGQLREASFDGSWSGALDTGWVSASAPAAAIGSSGDRQVFWQSSDGNITEVGSAVRWAGPVDRWSVRPKAGAGPYVEAVQTAAGLSQHLTPLSNLRFSGNPPPPVPIVGVDDSSRFQRLSGVGGAMTDSAAWLIHDGLAPAVRAALIDALFGADGIRLNYTILPIGGSDFTRDGNPYTYDDLPAGQTDPALTHFSIAHDQSYIIPTLRQMLAVNRRAQILAVPWTPPPWMKANGAYNDAGGLGTLLPDAYQPLADYFVKFLQGYAASGVPISAIAPENEPNAWSLFPAMRFPPAAEAQWITQNLVPALAGAGLHPRIYGGDTGWGSPDYPNALSTSAAAPALSGITWHCYGGVPTVMSALHAASAALDQSVAECAPNLTRLPIPEIVIGSLRNWASAVTLWNLALDPTGGPVEPPNTGCSGCRGLVSIDPATHAVHFGIGYYQLGQVSSYVDPGAQRIGSNTFVSYFDNSSGDYGATPGLDDVAFLNPDGSHVLVAYNTSPAAIRFAVRWKGRSFTYSLAPNATVTFRWEP